MCTQWNGVVGGKDTRPRKGMVHTMEYNPQEINTCYKTHMDRKAWNSCGSWTKKY